MKNKRVQRFCCHTWKQVLSQKQLEKRSQINSELQRCVFLSAEPPGLSMAPQRGDGNVKSKNNLMERVKGEVNKQERSTDVRGLGKGSRRSVRRADGWMNGKMVFQAEI